MPLFDLLKRNKEQLINDWWVDIITAYQIGDETECKKFFADYFTIILENLNQPYPKPMKNYLHKSLTRGFLSNFPLEQIFEFHLSLKRVLENFVSKDYISFKKENISCLLSYFHTIDNYFLTITELFGSQFHHLTDYYKQKYHNLTKRISEIIYTLSPQGNFIYISPSFKKEKLGLSAKKLRTINELAKLMPKEDRNNYLQKFKQIKSKMPLMCELRLINKKKKMTYYFINEFIPILDTHNNLISIEGILFDITKCKQTEKRLRQSIQELTIRNWIDYIFLSVSDEEIYTEISKSLLDATESKNGVIGYIDRYVDPDDEVLVYFSVIKDNQKYNVSEKNIVSFHETRDDFWNQTLIERKTFYSNNQFIIPQKKPFLIKRAVSVPIICQQNIIGFISVINKTTDYDQKDIQLLENVAESMAPILQARLENDRHKRALKQAERELEKYRKAS